MSEASILLQLLQGSSGTNFASTASGWDNNTPVCDWQGITCSPGTTDIVRIDLSDQQLEGSLPNGLGTISTLRELFLGSNQWEGTIPSSITRLPNLATLDLSFNNLRGTIPPVFGSPSNHLEFVSLAHNTLDGPLPATLTDNMNRVRILDLQYNRFSGSVPDMSGDMGAVEEINFSNNLLRGTIPTFFGRFVTLQRLFLSNNQLSGTIPLALTDRVLVLSEIFLHGNELSGTLPAALADLPNLEILFVDNNKLTGSVPPSLCELSLNEVFFHTSNGNELQDVDQTYQDVYGNDRSRRQMRKKSTENVDFDVTIQQMGEVFQSPDFRHMQRQGDPTNERDGCTSIACPVGYRSSSFASKDGVFPCVECDTKHLNPYLGASTCFSITQEEILQTFYQSTNGPTNWTGAQTWADPNVPTCEKEGIICTEGGSVASIVLQGMGLSGTIPPDIGFLSRLTTFDVSGNSIGGALPADLHLAPLQFLDVSENLLTGPVPIALCTKSGTNGNGLQGVFSCDTIACRSGTSSSIGRASAGTSGEKCANCGSNGVTEDPYLGSTECDRVTAVRNGITPFGLVGEIGIALVGIFIMLILFGLWRRSRKARDYINDRAYNIHGPGKDEFEKQLNDPEAVEDGSETDPLAAIQGIEGNPLAQMEIKIKDDWSAAKEEKEVQKEVWLDVPKIQ